uniref:Chitin-binding type-2 domain-containing protein n=1 Tax=Anopheles atroparvus TaxID=41427 RepID=A0AAG5DIK2_ANOAO
MDQALRIMLRLAAVLFFVACATVLAQSTVCVGQSQHRFVAHETDCWRYYTCLDGQAVLHECPESSVFVEAIQKCDFGDPITPPSLNPLSGCIGNVGISNVPHPTDCTLFYLCMDQMQFLQQCGPNLVFDLNTLQCNRPELSVCVENIATPPTATPAPPTAIPIPSTAPTPSTAPATVPTAPTFIPTAPTPFPTSFP